MPVMTGLSPRLSLAAPRARGDPRVEAELCRRIRARGRIAFAEFMEVALYLLEGGYYEAHAQLGRRGDFLTSPETHPVFGALLARLCALMWRTLGCPGRFTLIEYGAGTGSLCRQILEAAPRLGDEFASALQYCIIERSAFLRALQQARLIDLVDRVQWVLPSDRASAPAGCVVANEVVDALPVHRVTMMGRQPREVYVGMVADRYLDLLGPLSRPELRSHLGGAPSSPPDGSVVEVNLAARDWLGEAAGRIGRGYLVTIDFGGSAEDLCAQAGPRGGLRCFWYQGWTDDPYDRPGLLDIAAPVDFTTLVSAGQAVGLSAQVELSQRELLQGLGIAGMMAQVAATSTVQERERNLRALEALTSLTGLGAYRVLIQGKKARPPAITWPDEAQPEVPLLPAEPLAWPR